MKVQSLKQAEKAFMKAYPGGFSHPEMVEIGKRHKMESLTKLAKESFNRECFANPKSLLAGWEKQLMQSSMISMFEKPKIKRMVAGMSPSDKKKLAESLLELLHGKEKVGFEAYVAELKRFKMGRWPIVTAIQAYYRPTKDVFVKPNTTKMIISELDLDLEYHSNPTWDFYRRYRNMIKDMKKHVDKSLAPSNAAFSGFLMMSFMGE